jgi:hypothetical protein
MLGTCSMTSFPWEQDWLQKSIFCWQNRCWNALKNGKQDTMSVEMKATEILPLSDIYCQKIRMRRENSGIEPKRHHIRFPCNEIHTWLDTIECLRWSLNVHLRVFSFQKVTKFRISHNSTEMGPLCSWSPVNISLAVTIWQNFSRTLLQYLQAWPLGDGTKWQVWKQSWETRITAKSKSVRVTDMKDNGLTVQFL